MRNKKYSRNAEEKLQVVKYAAKHYETDESNIRYWRKQKLVLAKMPAIKTKNQIKFCTVSRDREQTQDLDCLPWK